MTTLRRAVRNDVAFSHRWYELVVAAALSAWLLITAASQHPNRGFDRLRPTKLLAKAVPDWRFFAPNPMMSDFHLLYRVVTADGHETPWREAELLTTRRWLHTVWFPSRREDKAFVDIVRHLTVLADVPGVDLVNTSPYQLLQNFVEQRVRGDTAGGPPPQGFQFMIVSYTGYDEDNDPERMLASAFVKLDARTPSGRSGAGIVSG